MPTAKVTKNVSAAIGGGNVLCSTLISIKTKAWLYSFGCNNSSMRFNNIFSEERLVVGENGLKNILVQPSAKDETK